LALNESGLVFGDEQFGQGRSDDSRIRPGSEAPSLQAPSGAHSIIIAIERSKGLAIRLFKTGQASRARRLTDYSGSASRVLLTGRPSLKKMA
jgi:hypothetical protein